MEKTEQKLEVNYLERYFQLQHGLYFTEKEMKTILGLARQEIVFFEGGKQPAIFVLEDQLRYMSAPALSETQKHFVKLAMFEYAAQFRLDDRVRETGAMPNLGWLLEKIHELRIWIKKKINP